MHTHRGMHADTHIHVYTLRETHTYTYTHTQRHTWEERTRKNISKYYLWSSLAGRIVMTFFLTLYYNSVTKFYNMSRHSFIIRNKTIYIITLHNLNSNMPFGSRRILLLDIT